MKILLLFLTLTFAGELEVNGDLTVTGTVDANGNPITNVGEPVVSSDVATANYVLERTAGKGRIIKLECVWTQTTTTTHWSHTGVPSVSCTPPECAEGWVDYGVLSNQLSSYQYYYMNSSLYLHMFGGNTIRYCMEQEDE